MSAINQRIYLNNITYDEKVNFTGNFFAIPSFVKRTLFVTILACLKGLSPFSELFPKPMDWKEIFMFSELWALGKSRFVGSQWTTSYFQAHENINFTENSYLGFVVNSGNKLLFFVETLFIASVRKRNMRVSGALSLSCVGKQSVLSPWCFLCRRRLDDFNYISCFENPLTRKLVVWGAL